MAWNVRAETLLKGLAVAMFLIEGVVVFLAPEGIREPAPPKYPTDAASPRTTPRSLSSLAFGWRFHSVPSSTEERGEGETEPVNWWDVGYNDSVWRLVDLPHDMAVESKEFVHTEGKPDNGHPKATDANHGYRECGIGMYRREFVVPSLSAPPGTRLLLRFDGAMRSARVWVNGHTPKHGATHDSGYTPWIVDVSSLIRRGASNLVSVRTDCSTPTSWWYDGGGLTRLVWFEIAPALGIDPWGVFAAYSVVSDPHGGAADVAVRPEVNVGNHHGAQVTFDLAARIASVKSGEVVSNGYIGGLTLKPGEHGKFAIPMPEIKGASLWSPDKPALYSLQVVVMASANGVVVDWANVTTGFRTAVFDPKMGFSINGEPLVIKGMCNHQDFAAVGTAVPDNLQRFRVARMKEMGGNAWRAAHNPPNTGLLDACDEMGLLVWDENHLNIAGGQYDEDVRAMVLRDRNHPSVISWSICNEALCNGWDEISAVKLRGIIKEHDTSRPVTAAINQHFGSGFQQILDLVGINYHHTKYDEFRAKFPNQPFVASETASSTSDRGIYETSAENSRVTAYDTDAVPWGATAQVAWDAVATRPFMSGAFVWTGFDYRGEPTPYLWPNVLSHFGVIDICGFPKDNFYYYKAIWSNSSSVHILPHWNWNEGKTVDVWTYSNGHSVELFLNGASLGKKATAKLGHNSWAVPFAAGVLSAVSYDSAGAAVAMDKVVTAGEPAAVSLGVQGDIAFTANGQDVALIAASIVDRDGNVVPTADNAVEFSVDGNAVIVGVGNGDPNDHDPETANRRRAFNGKCLLVVRSIRGLHGNVTVLASSRGLGSSSLRVVVSRASPNDRTQIEL